MIPIVGKNERLEVSFEIKGSGEVDAEALNRFHGVHFGDEVETEDVPSLEQESVEEETTEVESSDEESSEEEAPKVTWREDVLLRVMKASGIEDRDAFIAHAVNFDHDDNGYLKKAELEDAAKAWNEANSEDSSEPEEEVSESTEDDTSSDAEESSNDDSNDEAEEKACPICSVMCPKDAKSCATCSFIFI